MSDNDTKRAEPLQLGDLWICHYGTTIVLCEEDEVLSIYQSAEAASANADGAKVARLVDWINGCLDDRAVNAMDEG